MHRSVHHPPRRSGAFWLVGWLVLAALLSGPGCSRGGAPAPEPVGPLFFPPAPQKPYVQYLGWISSPDQLPRRRSAFADFVLGEEPIRLGLMKPNNARLHNNELIIGDSILNALLIYDMAAGGARPLRGMRGNGAIQQPNNFKVAEDGRIFVADRLRQAVLVYEPDGSFAGAWGRPGESAPVDLALGPEELFVLDIQDQEIEVWSRADGSYQRTIGGPGHEPGQFTMPTYLALGPDGHLYVTDTGNFRVQKLSTAGEPLLAFGGHGNALGQFAWPKGLDVDAHGRIYVADTRFANVQIFDPQGRLLLFFGGPGPDRGNLDLPAGVSIHPWPRGIAFFDQRLAPGFDPEFLVIVVNQWGEAMINFFAVARTEVGS